MTEAGLELSAKVPAQDDACGPPALPAGLKSANDALLGWGLNPDWTADTAADKPEVPAFTGRTQIAGIALMFTLWARVEPFLYEQCGIEPLENSKQEKKALSILRESETSVICLLCLLNDDHYSASGLIDAMLGEFASADERGNARKRLINRTLPVIADHYGLLQVREHVRGKSREYSICRSERLAAFAQNHLVSGFNDIVAAAGEQS